MTFRVLHSVRGCVKFSERYGERAHRLLAERGLVPPRKAVRRPAVRIDFHTLRIGSQEGVVEGISNGEAMAPVA